MNFTPVISFGDWLWPSSGPRVLPMLSREVVERQQRLAVLHQATHRFVVFDAQVATKASKAVLASIFVSAIQMSCRASLALDCWLFGNLLSTLAVLCTQQG